MVASSTPKNSVAELEQQIATLSAALEKARAQELAAAQKAVAAGEKALASASKKVTDISAKGVTTVAAKARLAQAKKDQLAATKMLAAAKDAVVLLHSAAQTVKEVAKELAVLTKGKTKKTASKKSASKKTVSKKTAPKKVAAPKAPVEVVAAGLEAAVPAVEMQEMIADVAVETLSVAATPAPEAAPVITETLPFDDDKGSLS